MAQARATFSPLYLSCSKVRRLLVAEVHWVEEPELPGALERLVALGHQFLVFLAAHGVHRFVRCLATWNLSCTNSACGTAARLAAMKAGAMSSAHRFNAAALLL